MNRLLILSVFLIACRLTQGEEPSLELKPPHPTEIFRAPVNETYQLNLTTPAIKDLTEKPPGPITLDPKQTKWTHLGIYRVTKSGPATLGPFSLKWHEKTYTSKPTHVKVLPGWDGVYKTILTAKREEIDLGDTVYIYLESWSKARKKQKPDLRESDAYDVVSKTYTYSYGTYQSRPADYRAMIFEIRPTHDGSLSISAENITLLEKGLNLTPLVINVKARP